MGGAGGALLSRVVLVVEHESEVSCQRAHDWSACRDLGLHGTLAMDTTVLGDAVPRARLDAEAARRGVLHRRMGGGVVDHCRVEAVPALTARVAYAILCLVRLAALVGQRPARHVRVHLHIGRPSAGPPQTSQPRCPSGVWSGARSWPAHRPRITAVTARSRVVGRVKRSHAVHCRLTRDHDVGKGAAASYLEPIVERGERAMYPARALWRTRVAGLRRGRALW